MRRIRILLLGLTVAFVGLGWTMVAHAQDTFRTGNDITISEGQSVGTSVFASGKTIDIAGSVDGDVFCVGQDVTITGDISGDVICAGQTVNVAGHINGNIRVLGQSVTIGGSTARSVTAAGQTVTLESSGGVGGDTTIAGQSVTLNGTVGRDLAVSGDSVTINGIVNRDVQATISNLTLGANSRIAGDLSYVSKNHASRAGGAQVVGTVSRTEPSAGQDHGVRFGALIGGGFWFALYMFIALLLVALVLILLIPQFIHNAAEVAMRSPWKTLLVGILASIIVPILIVVLMFTLVGIPLAILLLLSWFIIVCVSVPFAAYYFGTLLLGKNTTSSIWIMLLGSAIILVLFMIPLVGFLVWLVSMWFGLGIILLQYSRLPRPRYARESVKR